MQHTWSSLATTSARTTVAAATSWSQMKYPKTGGRARGARNGACDSPSLFSLFRAFASSSSSSYVMEAADATCGAREAATATSHLMSLEDQKFYHRYGYLLKPGLFNPAETDALLQAAMSDRYII